MKRAYIKPEFDYQEFTPNEFCSSCGESGVVYKFTCDAGYLTASHTSGLFCGCGQSHLFSAPSGTYEYKGDWYVTDGNGNSLMNGWASYSPCGEYHEAESTDAFVIGYMDNLDTSAKEAVKVMTWAGPGNDDIHCTTELDMSKWETAKS